MNHFRDDRLFVGQSTSRPVPNWRTAAWGRVWRSFWRSHWAQRHNSVFFGQNPRYFPWWTHQNGDDTLDIYTIRWYDCYFRMARFRRWQLKIHQNPFLEVMDGIAGIAGRYFHSSIYFWSFCRWATETWPAARRSCENWVPAKKVCFYSCLGPQEWGYLL